MAVYVYETTDETKPSRRFEISQSMHDEPLTSHPETGEPIRRVISGGFGYMAKGNAPRHADMRRGLAKPGGHCCGAGRGCG